jgi:hypothetical protein
MFLLCNWGFQYIWNFAFSLQSYGKYNTLFDQLLHFYFDLAE